MTEHANEVIADDNAGTRRAIESIKQHKARCVTAAEWAHMGQHGMSNFPKRLLPSAFGMLMYEGDPAVTRRTLSNAPLPARLLIPIIAPCAFSRHAWRVYGKATPPTIPRNQTPQPRGSRMRHFLRRNHAR
jgi:hypothetical protein